MHQNQIFIQGVARDQKLFSEVMGSLHPFFKLCSVWMLLANKRFEQQVGGVPVLVLVPEFSETTNCKGSLVASYIVFLFYLIAV